MAWIKIEHTLPTKPEVFQLAKSLLMSRQEVVGHLVAFWVWVDQNSEDGTLEATEEMVDSLTTTNFAFELMKQGWISLENDILKVKDFEKHNSNSAKKGHLEHRELPRCESVTQKALPEKRRIEKRKKRKEKKHGSNN